MRMGTGNPVSLDEARIDRAVRPYRDALRSINDIARRAINGQGETRMNALLTIDRISARRLNDG